MAASLADTRISAAPHASLSLILHKLTIEFDQLDDQRAAFQIISNQLATAVMPFDTVANLFRDSLGYIDNSHDITTSSLLPDTTSLPSIVQAVLLAVSPYIRYRAEEIDCWNLRLVPAFPEHQPQIALSFALRPRPFLRELAVQL